MGFKQLLSTAAWLSLALSTSAAPVDDVVQAGPPTAKSVTTIHKFLNGTWIENLAIRANGGVLLGQITGPNMYYIDPFSSSTEPVTIVKLPKATTGIFGIGEAQTDIFYFATGQVNIASISVEPGTGQVWRLDLSKYPKVAPPKLIANVTGSGLLNSLTTLPSGKILVSDSYKGVVWRVDAKSGAVDVAIDAPALKMPTTACGAFNIGVNGIHAVPAKNALYFTNSGTCTYGKFAIDADGNRKGRATVLFQNNDVAPDDFALVPRKDSEAAFIADGNGERVVYTDGTSNTYYALANIAGPTSAALGRRAGDKKSLYITSSGGSAGYAQKPIRVGGALTKIALGNY